MDSDILCNLLKYPFARRFSSATSVFCFERPCLDRPCVKTMGKHPYKALRHVLLSDGITLLLRIILIDMQYQLKDESYHEQVYSSWKRHQTCWEYCTENGKKTKAAAIKLIDGTSMPKIGLGVWLSAKGQAGRAVKYALENGYRLIVCARIYHNEEEIGQSLNEVFKAGKVKREDVCIISNLWCSDFAKEYVVDSCKLTLKNLQLDYLDQYLVYLPARLDHSIGDTICGEDRNGLLGYTPELMKETWQEMEKLVDIGLVKSIGISNFTVKKVTELLEFARIKPVCNQIELHPYLPQSKLVEFCKEKGIVCMAFSPIGAAQPEHYKDPFQPVLLKDDAIVAIAQKHKCSPAQILLAWGIQRGTPVLPRAFTSSRLDENLQALDIKLDHDDIGKINKLKPRRRYVDQKWGKPLGMSMEDYWDGEYLS